MKFVTSGIVEYLPAMEQMQQHADSVLAGGEEITWLLEHPPLYTVGSDTRAWDIQDVKFPVHQTQRGGRITYHGPGQRILYLSWNMRSKDTHAVFQSMYDWIIASLAAVGCTAVYEDKFPGFWVGNDKIAAMGFHIRQGITYYGISINVNPDLSHYEDITPCGILNRGVTSLAKLGIDCSMEKLDQILVEQYNKTFS